MQDESTTPDTEKNIVLKDDILYRQYCNKAGDINHLQVLLSVQSVAALFKSLHGTVSKHPGITHMMQEVRCK